LAARSGGKIMPFKLNEPPAAGVKKMLGLSVFLPPFYYVFFATF
jgi:hypothetical protein